MFDNASMEHDCENCKYNYQPNYVEPYEEPCKSCGLVDDKFEPYIPDGELYKLTVSQCLSSDWCRGYNAAVENAQKVIKPLKAEIERLKEFEWMYNDLCR